MGFLSMLAGLIVKEPISSGIAKFTETIGEQAAKLFMGALSDRSKAYYKNAAENTSESIRIDGFDKNDVKNALTDALKEFTKQSNITLKIPDYMQTVYDALDKAKNADAEYTTNFICNKMYEKIMQESDDNGGNELKKQFETARNAYVEKNRKIIELKNTEKYGSPSCEISDEMYYDNIVIAFGGNTILPFEFIKELQDGACETYGISYNYNGLGNSVSFELVDGYAGEDARDICDEVVALLEKYGVDKTTILIYANETE